MIGLTIAGAIGLYNFGKSALPVILPRITENIPTVQKTMFDEFGQYPILVEAPKEVRPGSETKLTIRGAEYQNFSTPITVSFNISTENLTFVREINSTITETVAFGNEWLLTPKEITVTTVNLDTPPDEFTLEVTEIVVTDTNNKPSQFSDKVTVFVDRTPVPSIKVAQGIVSLLAFLIGVFGTFIAAKLFG